MPREKANKIELTTRRTSWPTNASTRFTVVDHEEVIPVKSWGGVSATKQEQFAFKVGVRFIPNAVIETFDNLQI